MRRCGVFAALIVGLFCANCSSDGTGADLAIIQDKSTDSPDQQPDLLPDILADLLDDAQGETTASDALIDAGDTDADKDGWTPAQGDCDDTSDLVYPGSNNHIEGVDYDCDLKREYTVDFEVIVDDAYPRFCLNDNDIGSSAMSYGDRRIEEYTAVMESGLNVVGINGKDIYGTRASMSMTIRVNGRLHRTNGISQGDPDTAEWRYFPKAVNQPRLGWCSRLFDDKNPPPPYTPWGPALLANEMGNAEPDPPEFRGNETDWLWDGAPKALNDSWFRLEMELPNAAPVIDPPSANPACKVTKPTVLAKTAGVLAYKPKLTAGGGFGSSSKVGMVWTEYLSYEKRSTSNLYGAIMKIDGTIVTIPPVLLVQGAYTARDPGMAWNGVNFGIGFENTIFTVRSGETYFVQMSPEGQKVGPEVQLTTGHEDCPLSAKAPDVAALGDEYGVVWHSNISGSREIYFARMGADGVQLGQTLRLTNFAGASIRANIVSTGTEYGVVWSDIRDGGNYEIYFARVDASGNKIGSDVRVTNTDGESRHARMIFANNQYSVVYQDDVAGNHEIYLVHIDAAGIPGTPIRVTADQGISDQPVVAYTGDKYAIVWRDDRTGSENIFMTRMDALGIKIGGDEQLTNTTQMSAHPELVWVEGQGGIMAWEEREMLPGTPVTTPISDIYYSAVTCQ
ncbi:MAG: hypothetical protein V1754_04645 [Pseudomonadota bacterium]